MLETLDINRRLSYGLELWLFKHLGENKPPEFLPLLMPIYFSLFNLMSYFFNWKELIFKHRRSNSLVLYAIQHTVQSGYYDLLTSDCFLML